MGSWWSRVYSSLLYIFASSCNVIYHRLSSQQPMDIRASCSGSSVVRLRVSGGASCHINMVGRCARLESFYHPPKYPKILSLFWQVDIKQVFEGALTAQCGAECGMAVFVWHPLQCIFPSVPDLVRSAIFLTSLPAHGWIFANSCFQFTVRCRILLLPLHYFPWIQRLVWWQGYFFVGTFRCCFIFTMDLLRAYKLMSQHFHFYGMRCISCTLVAWWSLHT